MSLQEEKCTMPRKGRKEGLQERRREGRREAEKAERAVQAAGSQITPPCKRHEGF